MGRVGMRRRDGTEHGTRCSRRNVRFERNVLRAPLKGKKKVGSAYNLAYYEQSLCKQIISLSSDNLTAGAQT